MSISPLFTFLAENQSNKFLTINENSRRLNSLFMLTVADIAEPPSTPPPSSSGGTPLSPAYILPELLTGDFAFNENRIAYHDGATWQIIIPQEGFLAYIQDSDEFRYFTAVNAATQGTPGNWNLIQVPGILPTGGTSGQVLSKVDGTDFNTQWVASSGGGGNFIRTVDITSSVANVEFDSSDFNSGSYDAYEFVFHNIVPVNNNAFLRARTSTDGGLNFDSSTNNYHSNIVGTAASTSSNSIEFILGVSNSSTTGGASGNFRLIAPHLAKFTMANFDMAYYNGSNVFSSSFGSGVRRSNADVDGIQFSFDSGNINEGTISMYGIRND